VRPPLASLAALAAVGLRCCWSGLPLVLRTSLLRCSGVWQISPCRAHLVAGSLLVRVAAGGPRRRLRLAQRSTLFGSLLVMVLPALLLHAPCWALRAACCRSLRAADLRADSRGAAAPAPLAPHSARAPAAKGARGRRCIARAPRRKGARGWRAARGKSRAAVVIRGRRPCVSSLAVLPSLSSAMLLVIGHGAWGLSSSGGGGASRRCCQRGGVDASCRRQPCSITGGGGSVCVSSSSAAVLLLVVGRVYACCLSPSAALLVIR
jgi:hypothetical protein